jgi:hypothetical protein
MSTAWAPLQSHIYIAALFVPLFLSLNEVSCYKSVYYTGVNAVTFKLL